jgi:hypothetical protein
MARFPISAPRAAVALLGILAGSSAQAQPCRDPDVDPLRSPIGENRVSFTLAVDKVGSAEGIDRTKLLGLPTESADLSNNPSLIGMVWPQLGPALINVHQSGMTTTVKPRNPPA